jgi:hypothetical protein
MTTTNITGTDFKWGHIGVIIFHTIIAGILIFFGLRNTNYVNLKKYILYIGVLLGAVSLLALVPILNKKDYNIRY